MASMIAPEKAAKRPPNGFNLSGRKSNLVSKNNKWKAQLVQGEDEKERMKKIKQKQASDLAFKKAEKLKYKQEAAKLDIELGFAQPEASQNEEAEDPNSIDSVVPEWKKQKMFLNHVFPAKIVCRNFQGLRVFKNKKSMQEYLRKVVSPQEWELNAAALIQMRKAYDEAIEAEAALQTAAHNNNNEALVQDKGGTNNVESKPIDIVDKEDNTFDNSEINVTKNADIRTDTEEIQVESAEIDKLSDLTIAIETEK